MASVRAFAILFALALALAACAPLSLARRGPPTPEVRGLAVARAHCAACHGVERGEGRSPMAGAPAFASLEMQHTAGLAGRLATLTAKGHYAMPPQQLTPDQAGDLVAYIESLHGR